MKFSGIFTWTLSKQKECDKGYLVLKYDPIYRARLGKVMGTLDTWQNKAIEKLKEKFPEPTQDQLDLCLRKLDVSIEFHYRKRTLDQNALMWALYEIEANEMNGGCQGAREQMVTAMELYIADLEEHGKRITIGIERIDYAVYKDEYRVIEAVILDNGQEISVGAFLKMNIADNNRITLRVVKGSSKFNTIEMAEWIDRIFNRIAYHGISVTQPEEIERYWREWREGLNKQKIILHDTILTQDEYKALNPICEASGEFIGYEGGELAHIQGFGMGGDRTKEPYRNYSSNWLHLKTEIHREIWHGKGIKEFLKQFPHLRYKVESALHREYKIIENIEVSANV